MRATRSDDRRSPSGWRETLVQFFAVPLTEDPLERGLCGVIGGVLWIGGGVVVLLPRLLGGAPTSLPLVVALLLSAGAVIWGSLSVWVFDWVDGPAWLTHLTIGAGLVVLSGIVYSTGDVRSTAWPYLTWLALYGCFFFRRRVAVVYLALVFLIQAAGLFVHLGHNLHNGYGTQLAIVLFGYCSVGAALISGKRYMMQLRRKAEWVADTDRVTGLASDRLIDRALHEQAATARQTGANFAIAVIDVDHLRQITEVGGHDASDAALIDIARCLEQMAAPNDVLARTGGDEFTWLMPDTSAAMARERVDAARPLLDRTKHSRALRLSAGVCDSSVESDPSAIVRFAAGALYWSKIHGRDQTQVYDPEVVDVLSADERAETLQRSQALLGLRALARAIDAKDPATAEHSERVGLVAEGLARTLGWDEPAAFALRDAALVHDVGKIGIDDAVLRKPAKLTAEERAHVNSHAEMSARIVEGVLRSEQVDWIRTHHERADGSGYPAGLDAHGIPAGGALLAIADAYDAMTGGRPYSDRRAPAEALAECRAQAGRHFTFEAVRALEQWLTTLPDPAAAVARVRDAQPTAGPLDNLVEFFSANPVQAGSQAD